MYGENDVEKFVDNVDTKSVLESVEFGKCSSLMATKILTR